MMMVSPSPPTRGQLQPWTSDGDWNPRRVKTLQIEPGKPACSRETQGFVVRGLSTYTVWYW